MANSQAPFRFRLAAALGAGLLALAFAQPAAAQSCENDIGALQQKRQTQIVEINKSTQDGKLDPIAACPRLRNLASIENEMLGYMQKNQNWCNIPDDVIGNVKEGQAKTASVAKQACTIAAQIRKQQQQQATGGGMPGFGAPPAPRLPAGPL